MRHSRQIHGHSRSKKHKNEELFFILLDFPGKCLTLHGNVRVRVTSVISHGVEVNPESWTQLKGSK